MRIGYSLILSCLFLVGNTRNIESADLERISGYILAKKYKIAMQQFSDLFHLDKTNKMYNHEYYNFLKKMGDYETIIKNKEHFELDKEMVEKLKKDLNTLKFGSKKQIADLINQSPFSLQIVYIAACYALEQGDRAKFIKFLNMAKENDINDTRTKILIARHFIEEDKVNDAILVLREINYDTEAQYLNEIIKQMTNVENTRDQTEKARGFVRLYDNTLRLVVMDKFKPSIYQKLRNKCLNRAVDLCINTGIKGCRSYANALLSLDDKNVSNAVKYIRICILDGYLNEANKKYDEYKERLPANVKSFLKNQIKELEEKFERQRREEEEEEARRKRQYQERRRQQMGQSENAGKDFKGYYECLGATKDMDEKQIKKKWKKAAKKAQLKMSQKENETGKEDDSELVKINTAKNVLTDKEKKELYDAGYDPEDKQQNARHNYQQHFEFGSGGDFGDFEDIISAFFGGKRSGRRQQSHFYRFS